MAYESPTELHRGGSGASDIFVSQWQAGTEVQADVNNAGARANGNSSAPSLSANGQVVVFQSNATNLAGSVVPTQPSLYARNLATATTRLVDINFAGTNSGNASSSDSGAATSGDGRYVVFASGSSDLVATDSNGEGDIFVRDLLTGVTTLVSVDAAGTDSADGPSFSPTIAPTAATWRLRARPTTWSRAPPPTGRPTSTCATWCSTRPPWSASAPPARPSRGPRRS